MNKVSPADVRIVKRPDFGAGFVWGCATSSYQVEGAVEADGRGESIWDHFAGIPGAIKDGSSGAIACDHHRLWRDDVALIRELGFNAYRFSIAWPRIFPNGIGDAPNAAGLGFYSSLVDALLEAGIEPWITLYHWDLPQALQERGGWRRRETIDAFAAYAHAVTRALGDRVSRWITHNEPWCTAFMGHYEGIHAPGERDLGAALQVCHHVLVSHGRAVDAIRTNVANGKVGITLSLHPILPGTESEDDAAAVVRHDGLRNRWFLDPLHGRGYPEDTWSLLGEHVPKVVDGDMAAIAGLTDFLGVNYYFPERVINAPGFAPFDTRVVMPGDVPTTAFGWEVCPSGLSALLSRITRDYAPKAIYITENGATYDDEPSPDGCIEDFERREFIQRHLAEALRAKRAGVPLDGYFAWSLLDNFEWAEGYTRRFGICYVDFETQKRTPKASGLWFRDFLAGRG